MTLEEIYYIGQTVAVIAILGSLGAIWVQLRKDHRLAKASSQKELLLYNADKFSVLVDNPSALESLQTCLLDYNNASSRQKTEFLRYLHKNIMIAETAVYLAQDKLVASVSHQKFLAWPAVLLSTVGGRQFWEQEGQIIYGQDVVTALDTYMREQSSDLKALYSAIAFLKPDEASAVEEASA
ncbi:MAG: hypothetical protein Pars92KO_03830 [Parasphingorhabdus sp.]